MELSYFPGCSLHGTAAEYDLSARAVCAALAIGLVEIDDWSCCGATSGHAVSGSLGMALPARNLALAARQRRDVVVPCAACFNRLRKVSLAARAGELPPGIDPIPDAPEVCSLLGLLASPAVLPRIAVGVLRPLSELDAVAYYGCLLVRPGEVTGEANLEDPQDLDRILAALGVTVRTWNHQTACCGGSLTLSRSDIVARLTLQLVASARRSAAHCIVTACPMCFANLESVQFESVRAGRLAPADVVPIFYFTELLGLALGLQGVESWLNRHVLDPRPLLQGRGLA